MRTVFQAQMMIGMVPIEEIELDLKSRDDVIAYLYGLQQIYKVPRTRRQLFDLLESGYNPDVRKDRGRPGMDLWRILVLAGLRQAIHCDYDRLALLANGLKVLRQMLGHSDEDDTQYNRQTIQDNVSALSPALLAQINWQSYVRTTRNLPIEHRNTAQTGSKIDTNGHGAFNVRHIAEKMEQTSPLLLNQNLKNSYFLPSTN